MYHIKEDKRVKKSAELICNGLRECLKTKNFSEITVTDVQIASTVGRATFYRLFDQLSDVLAYMLDNIFMNIKDIKYDNYRSIHDQFLEPSIKLWMENADLLQAIIEANRIDVIYEANKRNINNMNNILNFSFPSEYMNDYFIGIASSVLIGILGTWIRNGRKETAVELTDMINKIIKITYGTDQNDQLSSI